MKGDDARRAFEEEEFERARSWTRNLGPLSDEAREAEEASKGLVRELQSVGIPLRNLGELANVNLTYPASIPILLDHLRRPYSDDITATIIQILRSRSAPEHVHETLVDFLRERWESLSNQTLFALGDAITETVPKGTIDTLLEIVTEPKYGSARMRPMRKIARRNDPRVRAAIARYVKENENPWLAINALRLAKMWDYSDWVKPYLTSENEYHRAEAKVFWRALKKATDKARLGGRAHSA